MTLYSIILKKPGIIKDRCSLMLFSLSPLYSSFFLHILHNTALFLPLYSTLLQVSFSIFFISQLFFFLSTLLYFKFLSSYSSYHSSFSSSLPLLSLFQIEFRNKRNNAPLLYKKKGRSSTLLPSQPFLLIYLSFSCLFSSFLLLLVPNTDPGALCIIVVFVVMCNVFM